MDMTIIQDIWNFFSSPTGAALGFGLWVVSEALASIPAIKANSIFQLVHGFLSRFKKDDTIKVTVLALFMVSAVGCGKTLEQIRQTAHSLIDISGKVYEDTVDNAKTAKDTVLPAKQ
jgi:hypothetical protein